MATPGPNDYLGLVGTTVDQVRFDACVDAGGFGLIYRGHHQGLGETVAIKCLRIASIQKTNEAIREALAGRFRDETKLLYRLSQGNLDIVRCMSSGMVVSPATKEYTPYMILEWLEGSTLSTDLKKRRAAQLRPRTLEAAVTLLDPAAGALAYAHANDVVHRDVKPGNLFLTQTREGVRMKVLDFGLAKILSDEAIGVRPSVETAVGVHFCSPSYGAPEQFTAQIGKIGPWTDVYSLTLVLLEVLTGEKVRAAGTLAEGLLKAIDKKTGSPSPSSLGLHLPPAVEALLVRGVAQNPLERPRDAGMFWSALKEAMAASPKQQGHPPAATMMDDSVGTAMLAVRAAAAARQSTGPSPFAGTMLMQNAPGGAPHLVAHAANQPAGAGAGAGAAQPPPQSVAPQTNAPPQQAQQNVPRTTAPLKMTMPIGAMSPLAASMVGQQMAHRPRNITGPPHPSSIAPPAGGPPQGPMSVAPPAYGPPPMQPQTPQQMAPQPAPQPPLQPAGGRGPRTDPGVTSTSSGMSSMEIPKSGSGGLVFFIAMLLLAGAGGAYYWLKIRGH